MSRSASIPTTSSPTATTCRCRRSPAPDRGLPGRTSPAPSDPLVLPGTRTGRGTSDSRCRRPGHGCARPPGRTPICLSPRPGRSIDEVRRQVNFRPAAVSDLAVVVEPWPAPPLLDARRAGRESVRPVARPCFLDDGATAFIRAPASGQNIPAPELQYDVLDDTGALVGRCDSRGRTSGPSGVRRQDQVRRLLLQGRPSSGGYREEAARGDAAVRGPRPDGRTMTARHPQAARGTG